MATEIKSQADVSVVPMWMTKEECAQRYILGRAWHKCSTDVRIPGPLTEQYLLDNLKWMSEKGLFSSTYDTWTLEHLGYLLDMLSQEL